MTLSSNFEMEGHTTVDTASYWDNPQPVLSWTKTSQGTRTWHDRQCIIIFNKAWKTCVYGDIQSGKVTPSSLQTKPVMSEPTPLNE